MTTATTKYLGKLRCSNVHLQSGTEILTDAPTDNQGMGSAYSPTDLCALSLTTCIITTMAIYAQGKDFQILHVEAETTKHMASDPRRIARIEAHITIQLNPEANERVQDSLRRIIPICPVSRSLHPDVIKDVTISFI